MVTNFILCQLASLNVGLLLWGLFCCSFCLCFTTQLSLVVIQQHKMQTLFIFASVLKFWSGVCVCMCVKCKESKYTLSSSSLHARYARTTNSDNWLKCKDLSEMDKLWKLNNWVRASPNFRSCGLYPDQFIKTGFSRKQGHWYMWGVQVHLCGLV